MAGTSLSGIEFTIKGSTDIASKSIDNLIGKLSSLNQALSSSADMKKFAKGIESVSEAVGKLSGANVKSAASALQGIANAMKPFETLADTAKSIGTFARAMAKMAENPDGLRAVTDILAHMAEIDFTNVSQAANSLQTIAASARSLYGLGQGNVQPLSNGMKEVSTSAFSAAKNVLKFGGAFLATPFKLGAQKLSGIASVFSGFTRGLGRIAMFRFFRTIIKEITQALAQGTKNLYGWSKAFGGALTYVSGKGKTFAQVMDDLATSGGYFKNSIGAMVAPLISALAPAIDWVIDKVVALINVLNQLFALLGGATSWNRATRKAQEFEDAAGGAGGAAKEALRYLAPFDELNVLPDDKKGGGGGGGTDYDGMFEETSEFMEGIQDFVANIKAAIDAQDWKGLGELLGDKVNEIVDWMDEKGLFEKAGKKIGGFINAWFTTKYWTLETINFQNIGAKIAEFFNSAIGEIDFQIIGASIMQKFTIIGDFIIGAITNLDWGMIAAKAGELLKGALDHLSGWIGDVNWANVAHMMYIKIGDAIKGIDWGGIVSSIATLIGEGVGAGAAILMQFGLDLAQDIWNAIKAPFQNDENGDGKVTGEEIWNGIKQGITSAISGIGTWVKENIWQPFINGIKDAFGIASPATTMVEPGEMIAKGLLQGIVDTIKTFPEAIERAWTLVQAWFADLPAIMRNNGIRAINSFGEAFTNGVNSIIEWFNSTGAAKFLGIEIEPIKFEAIPEIPDEELHRNLNEAREKMNQDFAGDPVKAPVVVIPDPDQNPESFSVEDLLGGSGGEISFQAKVTKLDLASNLDPPIFNSTANFNDWQCYGSKTDSKLKAFTTWKSTANWNDYQVYGNKSGSSIARFTTWSSTANFTGKTIDRSKITTDGNNIKMDVTANITKFTGKATVDVNVRQAQALGGVFSHGAWSNIPQYAGGTSRAHGSIFVAGEAGPEVVGHIGGRTEVLNRSQLAATMYSAVNAAMRGVSYDISAPTISTTDESTNEDVLYRAFMRAIADSDLDHDINLDGEPVYRAVVRRNRQNTRATGVNQLAMA